MVFTLFFSFLPSFAQSKYFEKTINLGGHTHEGNVIEMTGESDIIVFGNLIAFNGNVYTHATRLNLTGDTLWSNIYDLPVGEQLFNALSVTNGGFAITGCRASTSINVDCEAYIQLFDSSGEIISFHNAGDPSNITNGRSLIKTGDGGYFLGGAILLSVSGSKRPYISKVSASGTQLWRRQYTDYDNLTLIRDIMPDTSDGGFYAVGIANFDFIFSEADVLFMKLDSLGYMEWDTLYNIGAIDEAICLERTANGGFLMGGISNNHAMLMKTSPSFGIMWKREYFLELEYGEIMAFVQDANEDIIFSGNMLVPVPGGTQEHAEAFITKADGETGELLWERRYGKPTVNDYSYDMTATPDGGYIFCGRADTLHEDINTIYSDVYLVKTNCMGMLTEPEAAFNYDAVDAFNVQFINQSQYVYPDSIDGGRYLWEFGDGATSTEPHPQHTFPDAAEYEVTLTAIVCSDTSVYTQTVSTTPTGIKPQARAESITILPPNPNPAASGLPIRMGIEFPHFIQNKTATLRLYDINGRLLHEGLQTGGGVYELPTSGLGASIYLYGVEWEGNVLKRGKLTLF